MEVSRSGCAPVKLHKIKVEDDFYLCTDLGRLPGPLYLSWFKPPIFLRKMMVFLSLDSWPIPATHHCTHSKANFPASECPQPCMLWQDSMSQSSVCSALTYTSPIPHPWSLLSHSHCHSLPLQYPTPFFPSELFALITLPFWGFWIWWCDPKVAPNAIRFSFLFFLLVVYFLKNFAQFVNISIFNAFVCSLHQ